MALGQSPRNAEQGFAQKAKPACENRRKSPSHIVAFWMTSCLSLGFQAILDELILVVPQCYTLPVGGCHSRSAGALLVFLCHAGSLFFVLVTASLCY